MVWNHRVMRFTEPESGDVFYKFVEVFHENDGKLIGYHDPFMWSETPEGIQELADRLLMATAKPVLDESEFSDFEEV